MLNGLIDHQSFEAALSQNAAQPLPVYQKALISGKAALSEHYQQGIAIDLVVQGYAHLVDQLLIHIWSDCGFTDEAEVALVAVGGYGRGELHPYSDVDLLILLANDDHETYRENIEPFLTMMWDIGLEVGHSVRSLQECIEESSTDITIATNIMESRLLAGSRSLFETMKNETGVDKTWSSHDFFLAKYSEQQQRYKKFNNTAYNLEPNIKEGPGGLRDIQTILWVAMRHFGNSDLYELVNHDFLTKQEFQTLNEGRQFLWQIRTGLHLLAKRREDRLLFDHQRILAKEFGYEDDECRLAVEHFMKQYYRTITELARLNEMLLQLFREAVLLDKQITNPSPINRRFQHHHDYLEVTHDKVFQQTPFAILELFLILAQNQQLRGVKATTIRLIRDHLQLIDEEFRNDLQCRSLFMEILRQPHGITHQLKRMNRYGVLAAYLPSFGNIVGQMQHDLFHAYTVDEHTLTVIRNLRRFTVPEYNDEFTLCSEVIRTIPKPELLYIAGLFHDIAKGRGGDHSKLGVVDTQAFCEKHDLSRYDTELITWLVRNHLVMSTTAQKKDISDPEVVHEFMQQIGTPVRLRCLFLLTVADIRATNPTIWNNWKSALFNGLFNATLAAFERSDNPESQQERIQEHRQLALNSLLEMSPYTLRQIERLFERYTKEYFLYFLPDEIIWHSHNLLVQQNRQQDLILLRANSPKGGTEVFVYTKSRNGIFALITTTLEQLGLNITDARIMVTNDGYVMDSFIVLDSDGKPINDSPQLDIIKQELTLQLQRFDLSQLQVNLRTPRQNRHFHFSTEITFRDDEFSDRVVMEVTAADRPGLLSTIAKCMLTYKVQLHNAKITTLGEKAEDSFYISLQAGNEGLNKQTMSELAEKIINETNE